MYIFQPNFKFLCLSIINDSEKVKYLIFSQLPVKSYQSFSFKSTKRLFFISNLGQFSEHKFEKSNFLARIWIKYFHIGIFVILGVFLINKYGCQPQAFFSVFQCFLDHRVTITIQKLVGGRGAYFYIFYLLFTTSVYAHIIINS